MRWIDDQPWNPPADLPPGAQDLEAAPVSRENKRPVPFGDAGEIAGARGERDEHCSREELEILLSVESHRQC